MRLKRSHRRILHEKITSYPNNDFVLSCIIFYLWRGYLTVKQFNALKKVGENYEECDATEADLY